MTSNAEISWNIPECPEAEEVFDTIKASEESLIEEINTTTKTKTEINNWFSGFLKKLQNMWDEFKQWHIGKAIAILIWTEDNNKKDTPIEQPNTNENPDNSSNKPETEKDPTQEWVDEQEKEPIDDKIVSIKDYIKNIHIDLRYATTNNFTWQKIYENSDAKLRYWTIKKLKEAQEELNKLWFSIKIFDFK